VAAELEEGDEELEQLGEDHVRARRALT